jgi:hypothetical protein
MSGPRSNRNIPHAAQNMWIESNDGNGQRASPQRFAKWMPNFVEIGAGEGIRTLDPNLGKVVLYP